MRRFRIEDKDGDLLMHVTLHKPPYENENVLFKTKLKQKNVTIKDVTPEIWGEE